jgi:putative tricarboxylic transport membrane protein
MVLAIVLGGRAESSFRQAMIGSQGDMSVMFSNGLVASITILSIIMLFWPLISKGISAVRGRPSAPAAGATR